jgi:flagellar biosynthesis protein FliQ
VSLRIDHQIFACLEISKPWVLDVSLLLIIILEATLALIQVPELFLGFLTKVEAWVLKILFMGRLKLNN